MNDRDASRNGDTIGGGEAMVGLERWYRRLLRAYPRWYRRQRGEEMLGTLMEDATPWQARPTGRVAVGIVVSGLRCRLRVGRSPAARVGALGAAAVCAVLTATVGAWLAWHLAAPALPDEQQAAAIAAVAVPHTPVSRHRNPFLFGRDRPGDRMARYEAGSVEFTYPETHTSGPSPLVASAGDALRRDGWSIGKLDYWTRPDWASPDETGQRRIPEATTLAAEKDGVLITISDSGKVLAMRIQRAEPLLVPVFTGIGLIPGGLVGWLLTAGVARRTAASPLGRQVVVGVLSIVTLGTLCALSAAIVWTGADRYVGPGKVGGFSWDAPPWEPLMDPTFALIPPIAALLTMATVAVSALPQPRQRAGRVPA